MAKILIIDDDDSNRESLELYFLEEGHQVIAVASGEKGIQKFSEEGAEVVILDIRLPDMDGFMVLKRLKEIDPEVKAIMITAFHDDQTIKKAIESGAYSYVKKPIDLYEFESVVSRAVKEDTLLQKKSSSIGSIASIKS
ncbi:MAG: response regulator [Syntrophales bacterium]|nr:response regulator [Syntrophales bacterium]